VLGEKMAALEGAEAAIVLASGMGATALAHLAILRPGDHLLASEWIYGGTRRLRTPAGIEVWPLANFLAALEQGKLWP